MGTVSSIGLTSGERESSATTSEGQHVELKKGKQEQRRAELTSSTFEQVDLLQGSESSYGLFNVGSKEFLSLQKNEEKTTSASASGKRILCRQRKIKLT